MPAATAATESSGDEPGTHKVTRSSKTSMNCEVYIIHVAILYSGVCVSVDRCNGNRGVRGSGA